MNNKERLSRKKLAGNAIRKMNKLAEKQLAAFKAIYALFGEAAEKYGSEFNWTLLDDGSYFENELANELSPGHALYDHHMKAIAKCDSDDDVIFAVYDSKNELFFAAVHLTYSSDNGSGYPEFAKFRDFEKIREYIDDKL